MKPRLTLKSMLAATVCCILITAIDLLSGNSWTSPKDFKTAIYWIIVVTGWVVYFLDLYRIRRNNNKNDQKAS